jgi:hypothetical protein
MAEKLEESENGAVVAVYETHKEADRSIRELQKWGFDMKSLSVIGKSDHTEEEAMGYPANGGSAKAWGKTMAFRGGLWRILFGSAFFFIPEIGPILTAGPLVGWIVSALDTTPAVGGLSAFGAALYNIGIPEDSAVAYEAQIKAGKFIIMVHGPQNEVHRTKNSLAATSHQGMQEYFHCA